MRVIDCLYQIQNQMGKEGYVVLTFFHLLMLLRVQKNIE
jgi:hypothetical protein